MEKIVYTRPDGGVSVFSPAPNAKRLGESQAEFLARVQAKAVPPDAVNVRVVDHATLPDDEFRDAWTQSGAVVMVDMVKARAIQEERINEAKREKARDLLEREVMGEDVSTEKAALQDIDTRSIVSSAATPEQLKAALRDVFR